MIWCSTPIIPFWVYSTTRCSTIAERPRCRVRYSFRQKQKTGTGRQYFTDIIGLNGRRTYCDHFCNGIPKGQKTQFVEFQFGRMPLKGLDDISKFAGLKQQNNITKDDNYYVYLYSTSPTCHCFTTLFDVLIVKIGALDWLQRRERTRKINQPSHFDAVDLNE